MMKFALAFSFFEIKNKTKSSLISSKLKLVYSCSRTRFPDLLPPTKKRGKVECLLSVSASISKKKIMRSRFSLSYVCSNRGAPRFSKVFRSTASARTLAHSVHSASHLPSSPSLSLSLNLVNPTNPS